MATLKDLTLRIKANTADLQTNVKTANQSVTRFGQNNKKQAQESKKAFSDLRGGVENMTKNITGNLTGMVGNLGGMVNGFMGVVKGVNGASGAMKIFKMALISTGIGALVVALGSVIIFLTKTEAGMDLMNKGLKIVGNTVSVFIDRLGYLGEAIIKLFKGDFAGAVEQVKKSYEGLGEQIKNNYNESIALADEQVQLEKDQIKFIEKKAQLELELSEALLKSKDEEKYSEAERLGYIRQAQKIQKEISETAIKLKTKELELLVRQQDLGENTRADDKKRAELASELIKLKASENDAQRGLLKQSQGLSKEVEKQLQDQREYNKLVKEAKELSKIDNVGGTIELKGIESLAKMSGIIKPVVQDFTNLKNSMASLDSSFEGLQAWSEGFNMLPASEQVGLLKDKLDELIPTIGGVGEAIDVGANMMASALHNAAVNGGADMKELGKIAREQAKVIIRTFISQGVASLVKTALESAGKFGPIGLALAPALAAGAGAIATSAFNSLIPKYENGGIIGGGSSVGDRNIIRANSGEMMLNYSQQGKLFNMIKNANSGSGNVTVIPSVRISGSDFIFDFDNMRNKTERKF